MIFLALGSNLGHRDEMLTRARIELRAHGVTVIRSSVILETPALTPTGAPNSWDQPYLNQVLEVQTDLSALDLLQSTQRIERQLGRRPGLRWGPRLIDIDILAFGNTVLDSDVLKLPHPHMHIRRFVLEPLSDLEPNWVHPVLGRTACDLLRELPA
jgi:2-amino-4-hydroxy-6-hydroxymethyldihydropteridine diphosphokinase